MDGENQIELHLGAELFHHRFDPGEPPPDLLVERMQAQPWKPFEDLTARGGGHDVNLDPRLELAQSREERRGQDDVPDESGLDDYDSHHSAFLTPEKASIS